MDLFKGKNSQALITARNRAAMYNPNRGSECNTDGTLQKSKEADLIKGGEGSKGGKVIGHTKSGKPIYDNHGHEGHKSFTSDDHMDAATAHHNAIEENLKNGKKTSDPENKKHGENIDKHLDSHLATK